MLNALFITVVLNISNLFLCIYFHDFVENLELWILFVLNSNVLCFVGLKHGFRWDSGACVISVKHSNWSEKWS